jgi:hypothetical protein
VTRRGLDVSEKPVVSGSKNNPGEKVAEAGAFSLGSLFNPEPGDDVNNIGRLVRHSVI